MSPPGRPKGEFRSVRHEGTPGSGTQPSAALIQRAIELGLLPATAAQLPPVERRPWPVILLTALGAWLAAIPLLLFVGMLLGPLFDAGVGAYLAGVLALGLALALWRRAQPALFLEQLALPALLVGFGALGFALQRDLGASAAAALLAVLAAAISLWLRQTWLRVLLGAAAAVLLALALGGSEGHRWLRPGLQALWMAWHALLMAWLIALACGPRLANAALAHWLEAFGSGWVLALVAGLAVLAGMSFLVGGSMGLARGLGPLPGSESFASLGTRVISTGCALGACAWAARQWAGLRRPVLILVAAVTLGLSALMPTLGAVLLVLALCASSGRHKRALAAAVAAAWIVGAFYYALQWPLGSKALALVLAGALLGGVAAWMLRGSLRTHDEADGALPARGARTGPAPAATQAPERGAWLLPLAALLTLAASGWAVWQKERLIAQGRPAFVELAPVDPRSLMQGDYMTLAWRMPEAVRRQLDEVATTQRPRVAAQRDARQILGITRLLNPGEAAAAGEELIELSPKDGRWVIVTDAWFFREGEAARWQPARYGEFRLMPDGRALLVGLRGAELKPL